ncbi:Spermidine N(1)-acetyltransferase [Kordia antarctica]|uniref:Spermidine N(1)-acetyltransferase n=1 Tax=Kordia antarctica TaxID=1218801 RepID=A0A7L4ZS97_9FLAO|nr:GNAT family N-acetyltransferase [Kordia antarctica]QHI39351.1 Spermidine N(1)-acetyltransferase [Kordia antarctica]
MLTLTGKLLNLRALEPEDLDFIYDIENDESIWEISATQTPYSRFLIKQYLENAHQDIYEAKQLRLVMVSKEQETIGLIDLFEFDPKNKRVGIGLLIAKSENRYKGFGKEALQLVCEYAYKHLNVHQVFANIGEENEASIKLFENLGFQQIGVKRDWNFVNGKFKNELFYQKLS